MKKRDRIVILFLVGVMLFSAFATGLLLVFNSPNEEENLANQTTSQTSDPAAEQAPCAASEEALVNTGDAVGPWPYVTEQTSELVSEDLRVGTGDTVELNDCIVVHYRLAIADGTPVEGNDTFTEGEPIAFELAEGRLIEGWTQGIPGMNVGGVRRLTVPPNLGYGDDSSNPSIPAGSTLVFEVEVVEVK